MKKIVLIFVLSAASYAQSYMGCAQTKKEALVALSSNINVNVDSSLSSSVSSSRENSDEDVKSSIQSYSKVSTHLDLVNIQWKENNNSICAIVEKADQTKHTQTMLNKVLLYNAKDLPKSLDDKLATLTLWLKDLEQVQLLYPVFLENISVKERLGISKKQKEFKDLYAQTLVQMDSLIWKSCGQNKEDALSGLNKKLFNKEKKKKGFFEEFKSFVTTNPFAEKKKDPLIKLLEPQISYTQNDKQVCAVINKLSLLDLSKKIYGDAQRFAPSLLEQEDQLKRYKQIQNKLELLHVAMALISLYPNDFSSSDKNSIDAKIKKLNELLKGTNPQYVTFHVQSKTPVQIKLDTKSVNNNEKIYISSGEHSYTITTQDRCPITGELSLDPFDSKNIDAGFEKMHFPTLLVLSDQENVRVIVDGDTVAVNKKISLKKCEGELAYLAKLSEQSKEGTIKLEPNGETVIELNFLSDKENSVFNDAKTKQFQTNQGEKFSDSLTPIESKKLLFKVSSSPQHGSLDLDENGHFVYSPDQEYAGRDSFEFVIKTPEQTSSPRVVNIEILPSKKIVPVAAVIENNTTKKADTNDTVSKDVEKTKKEVTADTKNEERYQKFKKYVEDLGERHDLEKIRKLKETYPDMFSRFLKEKLAP